MPAAFLMAPLRQAFTSSGPRNSGRALRGRSLPQARRSVALS